MQGKLFTNKAHNFWGEGGAGGKERKCSAEINMWPEIAPTASAWSKPLPTALAAQTGTPLPPSAPVAES